MCTCNKIGVPPKEFSSTGTIPLLLLLQLLEEEEDDDIDDPMIGCWVLFAQMQSQRKKEEEEDDDDEEMRMLLLFVETKLNNLSTFPFWPKRTKYNPRKGRLALKSMGDTRINDEFKLH